MEAVEAVEVDRIDPDENALARYSWSLFDQFMPDHTEIVDDVRRDTVEAVVAEIGEDFSFRDLCRSTMAIDALWKQGSYQLTFPWLIMTDKAPLGEIVGTPEEWAKEGRIEWDGVEPPTIQQAVNNITRQVDAKDGKLLKFFQSPTLLEVELTPAADCKKSLDDLFQFSVDHLVVKDSKADNDACELQPGGEQAYVLSAAVKHRQSPGSSDLILMFAEEGSVVVPLRVLNIGQPDWGFGAADPIPGTVRISLFYKAVESLSPGVKISQEEGLGPYPAQLAMDFLDFAEEQRKYDLLNAAQSRDFTQRGGNLEGSSVRGQDSFSRSGNGPDLRDGQDRGDRELDQHSQFGQRGQYSGSSQHGQSFVPWEDRSRDSTPRPPRQPRADRRDGRGRGMGGGRGGRRGGFWGN